MKIRWAKYTRCDIFIRNETQFILEGVLGQKVSKRLHKQDAANGLYLNRLFQNNRFLTPLGMFVVYSGFERIVSTHIPAVPLGTPSVPLAGGVRNKLVNGKTKLRL